MPEAYNPTISRFLVIGYVFFAWAATFHPRLKKWTHFLYFSGMWLITVHFWYLIYENGLQGFHGHETNWITGSFVVAMATAHCMLSREALLGYSLFVTTLSIALEVFVPALQSIVFLPGIFTILIQANAELRTRHKVVQDLEESNKRFWLLFNSTFEGVIVYENERIVDVNEAILKMSEYTREELIGRHILDIVIPEERALVAQKMKLPDVTPYETKGLSKSGRVLDIEVRAKNFQFAKSLSSLRVPISCG